MSRPFCVGLTGGLAVGKSAVAARLAELGAEVVDTDAIARELTRPAGIALPEIVRAFGEGLIAPDGGLDRSAMRERVFRDPQARRKLETILHPRILAQARTMLERSNALYVVLVVPLLAEKGQAYRELIDRVLVVDSDEALQIRRAMDRDGISESTARSILNVQATRQARLGIADDVLENRGELDELMRRVDELHARYLDMAKKRADSLL